MDHQLDPPFGPHRAPLFAGLACVILLGLLIAVILFIITMQKALSRVAPHNRRMGPGMVWLALVPCLNIVWIFMIAVHVPESLKNEFRERKRDDGSDYGKGVGLVACLVFLASSILRSLLLGVPTQERNAALVGGLGSLLNLILTIIFWVKIARYSRMLLEDDSERLRRLREFDDDDGYDSPPPPIAPPPPPPSDGFKAGDPGEYK